MHRRAIFVLFFERARSRTLPKNMSPTNAHPQGELPPFLFYVFERTAGGTLPEKCVGKACHHRGNYGVFFAFAFSVVLAPPLFRDIFGWILVILGVFCGWGGASAAWGGTPWRPESLRDDFGMLFGGF